MEDMVIAGLGMLSHDTIGKGLVLFIVMLCVWTFIVHWFLVFPVTWNSNALAASLSTAFHQVIHGWEHVRNLYALICVYTLLCLHCSRLTVHLLVSIAVTQIASL